MVRVGISEVRHISSVDFLFSVPERRVTLHIPMGSRRAHQTKNSRGVDLPWEYSKFLVSGVPVPQCTFQLLFYSFNTRSEMRKAFTMTLQAQVRSLQYAFPRTWISKPAPQVKTSARFSDHSGSLGQLLGIFGTSQHL